MSESFCYFGLEWWL